MIDALRRLLAAPWLPDGQGIHSFDDEAIRSALPADDNAIVDQLMELHAGKVPESAVGISAKVTELKLNPRRYFIYLANGHWTKRPPAQDAVATAAARIAHIPRIRRRGRYGRAVLSARLLANTDFALNKKSIQTTLITNDAGGTPNIARYNIPLPSEALAAELLEALKKAKPAA